MVLRIFAFSSVLFLLSCSAEVKTSTHKEEKHDAIPADCLYVTHCESCHGLEGNAGISGAANLQKSTMSDKEIEKTILNGNDKGMMPYKEIITSNEEIKSLVEYVKTLRK